MEVKMEEKKSWRIEVGPLPEGCTAIHFFKGTEEAAEREATKLENYWNQRLLSHDCNTGHLTVQSSLIPIKK